MKAWWRSPQQGAGYRPKTEDVYLSADRWRCSDLLRLFFFYFSMDKWSKQSKSKGWFDCESSGAELSDSLLRKMAVGISRVNLGAASPRELHSLSSSQSEVKVEEDTSSKQQQTWTHPISLTLLLTCPPTQNQNLEMRCWQITPHHDPKKWGFFLTRWPMLSTFFPSWETEDSENVGWLQQWAAQSGFHWPDPTVQQN